MEATQPGRRIFSNILGLVVLRSADLLTPVILLPHLLQTIGLKGYGLFSLTLAFSLYAGALIQYGFNVTAPRDLARLQGDRAGMLEVFVATLSAQVVLTGVGALLSAIFIACSPALRLHAWLYALALTYTALRVLFPAWLFQVIGGMRSVAIFGVFVRIALIASALALVRSATDVDTLLWLYALSALASLIYGLTRARSYFGRLFVYVPRSLIVRTIKDGRHAFQSQLAPTLYNSSTTLILGVVAGEAVVGVLASAQKIVDVLGSGSTILSNACLPFLSRNMRCQPKFGMGMVLLGGILAVICIGAADPIVEFLYRDGDGQVGLVVKALALSLIGTFTYAAYNQNFLMIAGEERLAKWVVTVVSVISLLISLIAIPLLGLLGAVMVLILARTALGLVSYLAARKCQASAKLVESTPGAWRHDD